MDRGREAGDLRGLMIEPRSISPLIDVAVRHHRSGDERVRDFPPSAQPDALYPRYACPMKRAVARFKRPASMPKVIGGTIARVVSRRRPKNQSSDERPAQAEAEAVTRTIALDVSSDW